MFHAIQLLGHLFADLQLLGLEGLRLLLKHGEPAM